ncbi:MAG: ABC transporter substrate-binding protein [Alphaproteobacteria bacterium]|nr:MAG: ABC transporter substrate-binding protein [Alphaproteobacteria bacterium]
MRKFFTALAAVAVIGLIAGAASAEIKKVRIGTEGAYPPFNYIDENGKLRGFDVEIAQALCDAMKAECEFVVQDWDGIIPGLLAKKYDAIIASMSITEERKKKVDFTDKYYNTPAKFVQRKGAGHKIILEDGVDTVADVSKVHLNKEGLKGKTIAVQRATIHENFLRDTLGDVVTIRAYATQDEANMDLVSGRVDLVLADSVALDDGFLKTEAGKDFEFVGPGFTDRKWFGDGAGIAVRKDDTELREALNKALKQILADGTYKKINDKYFDFDVYGG